MMDNTPVVGRYYGTPSDNQHAVFADQQGTTGTGAALRAESANGQVPAISAKGSGVLLSLENALGISVFSVSQVGLVAASGGIGSGAIAGDATVTGGNVVIATAGKGLQIEEGTNATMGSLTLTGATPVTVTTTAVTATSRIFLTHNAVGGTPAFAWVSARSVGTSFTVTGTALDTSVLAWMIVNPAP